MSTQASGRGFSLRSLLGCGGERVDWRLPAAFAAAQLLSNAPELARTLTSGGWPRELVGWFLAVNLFAPVLVAAAGVLACRIVKNEVLAAFAGGLAYAAFMVPVRLIFSPRFRPLDLVYSWLWVFLLFLGLALALRWIRESLPLALGAGATAAAWLNSVLLIVLLTLSRPGVRFSFGGELVNAGLALVSSAIFALVFWGAIRLLAIPLEGAAAPAPAIEAGDENGWLRRALMFHGLARQLRGSGIGSVLFGVLAIAMGASTMGQVPINGALIVLGILLIAEGVWVMAAPSAAGLVVDGLAVMTIGIWNIGISLAAIGGSSGDSLTGRFLVFGILQLAWGLGRMGQYRRFADLRGFRLDPDGRARLGREIEAVRSATGRRDVVAFKTGAAEGRFRLLGDSAALFLRGRFVEVLSRKDVVCGPVEKSAGDSLALTLRVKKRKLSAAMTPDNLQRLREWAGAPAAEAVPPTA